QGIFLAPLEQQSSLMFEFVFKMFSVGSASLPAGGMGQVPLQIAADLPEECLLLNTKVLSMTKISDGEDGNDADGGYDGGDQQASHSGDVDGCPRVRLELGDGTEVLAHAAVVATEAPAAAKLLGEDVLEGGATPSEGRSSTCLYYAIDGPAPVAGPILVLNGEGSNPKRPVNNVVFLEQTAPSYAPQGKSLASVTVVGDPSCNNEELEARVRAHLREWFDEQGGKGAGARAGAGGEGEGGGGKGSVVAKMGDVAKWRHLRTYRVPYAQPAQTPPVAGDGFYGRKVKVKRLILL
ncbi:unnamed protein product, partial [Laminaria digitata]